MSTTTDDSSDDQMSAARQAGRELGKFDAGQSNLVELMIGLLLAGIMAMAVFIPVWTSVLNDVTANLTDTQTTIAELVPLFIIILILVAAVSPLRRRFN